MASRLLLLCILCTIGFTPSFTTGLNVSLGFAREPPRTVVVAKGKTVVLPCEPSSPGAAVTWLQDGVRLSLPRSDALADGVTGVDTRRSLMPDGSLFIKKFLVTYNPQKFGWILKYFEEIYLLLNYTVQQHYIRTYGASFSETFYGIQRFALGHPGIKLPLREKRLSLMFIVLVEYFSHKLDSLIEQWKTEQHAPNSMKGQILQTQRIFKLAWRSLCLSTLVTYMTGRTDYHSPLLKLAGVGLQTSPDENGTPRDLSKLGWFQKGVAMIGPGLARCLEIGAFTLQFLQWWHAEGPRQQLTALPVPSAPEELPGAAEYTNICPICLQTRRVEAVLPISGFVFCYRCIATHLEREGKCPVTNYPAKPADVIRIYTDL